MARDTEEEEALDATRKRVNAAITHDDAVALASLLQARPELKNDNLLLPAVRARSIAVIPLVLHKGRDLHLPDAARLSHGWTTAWILAVNAGGAVLNAMLQPGLLSDDALVECLKDLEQRPFNMHTNASLQALMAKIELLRVRPTSPAQKPPSVTQGRRP